MLEALRSPASATEVAARLGESRQRVNYHVRELERSGFIELVEERARRGCTERIMRATCHAVLVHPTVSGHVPVEDRSAPDTLLAAGARLVADVAAGRSKDFSTLTVQLELAVSDQADLERFAERVTELAADFSSGAHHYRVLVGAVPISQPHDAPPATER